MHKKMINEAMRIAGEKVTSDKTINCLLYTSPSQRDS